MNRLAILMTAVLLAGYSGSYADENTPILPQGELVGTAGVTRVYVFHDNENHNTCYITERSNLRTSAGAIDCLPMAYRNLHQESSDAISYR